MEVYGFKANVVKDGKVYAATVRELHANTQAKSLKELKENLKEVVRLIFEDVLHNENEYNKSVVKKVRKQIIEESIGIAKGAGAFVRENGDRY